MPAADTHPPARGLDLTIFDEPAATDAAAHLLRKGGGRMSCQMLLGLMYLAERRALCEHGITLIGARAASTASGPVLVEVWDLVHGLREGTTWQARISTDGDDVVLLAGVDGGNLSRYATRVLTEAYRDAGRCTPEDLTRYMRESCPEWGETEHMQPISVEDTLRTVGKSDEEIRVVVEDLTYYTATQKFFGGG